jgi:hypothetical protein
MNQVRLSPSDLDIIRDIVLRRAPDLVPVVVDSRNLLFPLLFCRI